jgi:hypothetical protein
MPPDESKYENQTQEKCKILRTVIQEREHHVINYNPKQSKLRLSSTMHDTERNHYSSILSCDLASQ